MKKIIAIFLLLTIIMSIIYTRPWLTPEKQPQISQNKPQPTQTSASWFYPITNYMSRIKYKSFGTYIDEKWYKNEPNIFPTHFYGFHAGVDLDATTSENSDAKLVPVFAVTTGKILYVGPVQGYGGVIIQQIDQNHLALYGHIKLSSVNSSVGEIVKAGQIICDLGNANSFETGGERKHLHFAIHKGEELYFAGYEQTLDALNANWENPTKSLQQRQAASP